MRVIFERSRAEAETIRTFYFRPDKEKPVRYTAGQFVELTLPHPQPDKRGQKRWFTLSSAPTAELLSITTRFAGAARSSSFKKALFELEPGAELRMSAPMGDFVLPKLIQTPLIFVAAGIGITPFHSILGWLADTGEQRPIKLLYGVHSEDDIIFQDVFNRPSDRAHRPATIVVSDPSPAWGGQRGHLTADLILGLEKPSEDTLIYLSGPEPLVEKLQTDLLRKGLKKHQLVLDRFPNYSTI